MKQHGPLLLRRLTQASINFKPRNLSNLNLTKEDENNCNDCGIRRFSISRVLEKASKWVSKFSIEVKTKRLNQIRTIV